MTINTLAMSVVNKTSIFTFMGENVISKKMHYKEGLVKLDFKKALSSSLEE